MPRPSSLLVAVGLAFALSSQASSQSAQLRIVDAAPRAELNQISEANEIRVVFSEPMVALGRIPSNPTPSWIRISPAIKGTFRWSGTTILIFTPDPDTPLPYGTPYTVTIDGSAASAAGRQLGSPYSFSFTTPTPRLTSMRWFRRADRFDRPVVLMLEFNQPMRAADVVPRATLRYRPHDVTPPELSAAERARYAATDPAGLRAFDAKVAAARQTAARQDTIAIQPTTDWDRERFPASDRLVALETTTVPPPGAWLTLTLDAQLRGLGPTPAGREQSSAAELDPVFFAQGFHCRQGCNPSGYNGLQLSSAVNVGRFASALSVQDITTPAAERPVARTATVPLTALDRAWSPSLEDAGYARQPPATTFAYRLDASLEATDGQTLGYPFIGIVENWHERAFTSFGDGHGVWETSGGLQLPFSSRNFTGVTEWLTRLQPSDLMPRIVALEGNGFRALPPGTGASRTLNVTPDATQAYGIDLSAVVPEGRGLVWAGVRPGEPIARSARAVSVENADRSTIVQVTNLGISVKDSPQSTLVFVTRLDNGQPVGSAAVSIINTDNQQIWRGTTGSDGVVVAPALPLRDPESWYELAFIVTAEKDGDIAYLASNWNEGIMPWDFGHGFQLWESTDILRGSVFTDRGVYRPGETVNAKAIVRLDTPNGIRLMPAGSTVDVRVSDSRGREVDRRTVTLNRWSSAEWTWTVPSESTLGEYNVRVLLPGVDQPQTGNDLSPQQRVPAEWLKQVHGSFLVAAYRRPDFRVDTTLTADAPVAGASLTGNISAAYLFGASLGARPVRWSITRQPDMTIPAPILERFPSDQYAFGYYSRSLMGSERIAGAETALGRDGTLTVTAESAREVDVAHRYTVEADVEDVSRQHIANRASLVVHPAPWYVGLRRPAYFTDTTTGAHVDVVVPALDGTPTAGIPVTVQLTRVQWNSVRRAEGGGFYTWDTEEIRTPAGQWQLTSAETPVPLDIPVPEGGSYVLTASATAPDGRSTKTETSFYALGRGYTAWQRFDHNRIELEPERRTWKPGETARVMIQSPWETATALLTIEREGIRRYERFTLSSTQQTIEVPITEDDIPNVFVSVLLIRGRTSEDPGSDGSDPGKPAFRLGYTELYVDDATKQLSVTVSADRQEYRPANTARVTVNVVDAAERPAASEVTLWAVDYGVLSLTGYDAPNVRDAVYQRKSLQVLTEDSRQRIVSRRVLTPKGGDEGGGGGDAGATDARRDFRPLAFWLGSVETDTNGTATREVTLPESLTTYRIMAVAADSASRFGSANADIKVNKPVTLIAAFPRFLTMGDRASFGAVVTNTLNRGGRARVTIRSLDADVLQIAGDASRTIQIGAASTEAVRFNAVALRTGTARVRMTVSLGSETDAFETTLPVTAPAPVETMAAFGTTTDRAVEMLAVPANVLPGTGGLTVQLASTALVGLGEGARYLVDYPFGCAEQKASAGLALALASDLGGAFSMTGIEPAAYRTRAATLLDELPRFQCANGGFAYWAGSCSTASAYLTAYVLQVMKTGEQLGLAPDAATVNRALDYLEGELRRTAPPAQVQWQPVWIASQAFAVKVLAEHGRNQDSNITRLAGLVDRLPIFALSYLADAMAASGQKGPRYDDVVRRISNAVRVEGDTAHVQEIDGDALTLIWHTNVRATAIVLDGFVQRGDDTPVVPQLVRWLLAAREDGRWGNTQENATALRALVAYYRRFEAAEPDFTATVTLAARPIGTATFRGRSSAAQQVHLAMPDLLRRVPAGTERELTVSRAGTGPVYYTTRLQYAPASPLPAADQGIRVERQYETFVENGDGTVATSFSAGDLIRVTLTVIVPQERRYVAVTDPMPAGLEAVDGFFRTTASDLARSASVSSDDNESSWWFERTGFDHVEKFDDRVTLFATRLGQGRHQFSYLVRATTAGTFAAAGTVAEQMYAPEVQGRAEPATLEVR